MCGTKLFRLEQNRRKLSVPIVSSRFSASKLERLVKRNFGFSGFEKASKILTLVHDPSSTAGDTVHLLLGVSYAPHPGFVHAIPFSNQSTGMVYVPTKCEVTDDASNSYTLFETTNDAKCTNDIIDLDISYVVNGPLCGSTCNYWRFSHTLFLLNSETISSYELSCSQGRIRIYHRKW